MSTPLVIKLPVTPAPASDAEPATKADGEPPAPGVTAIPGLSKAKKKRQRKKNAAAAAKSGAGPDEDSDDEPTADDPTKPAAAAPTAPKAEPKPTLSPEERRAKVSTLIAEDKTALAAEWGLAVDSEKFIVILRSQERYEYFQNLSPDERAYVSPLQIEKRKKPIPAEVEKHALEQRLLSWGTVTVADYAHLEKEWGLDRATPQFKAAMTGDPSYQMFRAVPANLRSIVSGTRIKKGTPLTEEEVNVAKLRRAAILKEEAEAAAAEKALAKDKAKLATSKADFEKAASDLKKRIAARIAAEIPDFVWETDFDTSVTAPREKVAAGAVASRQSKQLSSDWDAKVDHAAKVRDVNAELAHFARLKTATLNEIKDDVLADSSQTVHDFITRATDALSEQRNPTDITTWVRWMQLDVYPKLKALTDRAGLKVHFTISDTSISVPNLVTDATTPVQLLASLFTPTMVGKWNEAHVTLETGVENDLGEAKNPHKYWLDGPTEHELYYDPDRKPRWHGDESEADLRTALNDAMDEAKAALRARAQIVLDQAGK